MRFRIFLFFNQHIILNTLFEIALANPMIGPNIRQAREGEFPAVVSFMSINPYIDDVETEHICTGTLLSKTHVLTAAHCHEEVLKNETQIVAGSIDLRHGTKYSILWWVTYDDWARAKNINIEFRVNDISIIKLTSSVPSYLQPMTISYSENKFLYGLSAVAATWGVTVHNRITRIMETTSLTILSNTECEKKVSKLHGSKVPFQERLLCTVGSPFAVMQLGDSGCPLILGGVIIGIQKSNSPFPELFFHPEKVNVHTGVHYYRHFILDVLNSNQAW